ncbi:MAG: ABC transporter permease [Chloroflexota bacterium]|nr:ABC transporter permease [Chloroflexota bacterium]
MTANPAQASAVESNQVQAALSAQLSHEPITLRKLIWRQFLRHRLAVYSTIVLILIILSAVFAPLISPHSPSYIDPLAFDQGPTAQHLLGTDRVGRDVLSRLIYGGRISLSVGVVAVSIYMVIGMILGSLAGYYGGWVDGIISRIIDVVLSFPYLMLILVLVSLLGPGLGNIMMVLGLLGWPQVARILRGEFLRLRSNDFIMAARVVGAKDSRIIINHIIPNAMGPMLVAATFGVANAILSESALSFLGLGVQPPASSWGQMLNDAQSLTILESKPWLWVPPGIMILISVLAINFVGDGLRDALDPQIRR